MDIKKRLEGLYRWGEFLGLTRQEASVVLILAALTAAGGILQWMKDDRPPMTIEHRTLPADTSDTGMGSNDRDFWQSKADTLRQLASGDAPKARLDTFLESLSDAPVRTVNINRADIRELSGLAGVGPKLAERIIDFRQTHGEFRDVEDLRQVKGVGKKLIEKIKPFVDIH